MSTSPCPLPHSPLGLGDLGGLQILVGPADTKEQNQSLWGGGGRSGLGAEDGHRAEAGMCVEALPSCRTPLPGLFSCRFPCLSY